MNVMTSTVRAVVCAALLAFGLSGCDSTLTPDSTNTHKAALAAESDYAVVDGNDCYYPPTVDCACPPDACWENHGEYVSCVAHAVNDLRKAGYISGREGGAIVAAAGQSDIGKDGAYCDDGYDDGYEDGGGDYVY